jgi:pyruvate formate lyase activating enzyme
LTGLNQGCGSVTLTDNDPIISAEYALDTARFCNQLRLSAIAITAGYLTDTAGSDFFSLMDAANIDLKGSTEHFH